MEVSYNKLWKLMIDKGMPNKSDLRALTGIGTNTLAKLSKNQQDSEQRKRDSVLAVATTVREAAAKKRKELEAEGVIE